MLYYYQELSVKDRAATCNVIFKRIPYDASFALVVYLTEISEAEERMRIMLDSVPLAGSFIDLEAPGACSSVAARRK